MTDHSPNNPKTEYDSFEYLRKRWFSYWYQIKEVYACKGIRTILEVGPGNRIVTDVLIKMGYDVKTVDNDPNVLSDYHVDIRTITDKIKMRFDLVLCCQVLEHIPFEDIFQVLRNFQNIANNYLVVTLPYTSLGTFKPYMDVKLLPFLGSIRWIRVFDMLPQKQLLARPGGHYWEIGKKGYPLVRILTLLRQSGWRVTKHYLIFENPYHYMFVCERLDVIKHEEHDVRLAG